jgi:hypothetical protein
VEPKLTIEIVQLSAAIAEVHVHVDFANDVPTECRLRGRVTGPRCPGTETIEIAYPLRELPAANARRRSARLVIPEPNLWDTVTPFTYGGTVEVWREDEKVAELPLEIGLRQSK